MSQLDNQKNQELFCIIEFLKFYYSSDATHNYKSIINIYNDLIQTISNERYKRKVENSKNYNYKRAVEHFIKNQINPDLINKIFNQDEIIANFNTLAKLQQDQVIHLTWFVLYCKINRFDNLNYSKYEPYCKLIQQIKSLPEIYQWIK